SPVPASPRSNPTLCSRTSDCVGPDSGSGIPRSSKDCVKSSELFVSSEQCRPATPHAVAENFEEIVLPHLDAAYRLARWQMRNEQDAEDVVQEASLRALRYFRTFSGGNGRAWFLRIVRNTCAGWYGPRLQVSTDPFDEERHSSARPTTDP